jgi:hypothetical protein
MESHVLLIFACIVWLQVIINDVEVDVIHWTSKDHLTELPTHSPDGSTLDILVENLGRVNYADFKSPLLDMQRKGQGHTFCYVREPRHVDHNLQPVLMS